MLAKLLRGVSLLLVAASLISWRCFPAYRDVQASTGEAHLGMIRAPADVISPVYNQPIDPNGKLIKSSWLDPDGSNNDKYVWDNFTLPATGTVTRIEWVGGYDPTLYGAGGPVLDFSVDIYPSIPAGTEPAIAYPPLVHYMTGGNAGQTSIGMVGSIPMYSYSFSLPAAFIASAGVKYWVQIEAYQQGSIPDWGIAKGTGGNAYHYVRESGAGGDIIYHSVPDDAAFTVLALVPDTPTNISLSNSLVDENQLSGIMVGNLTATDPDPLATFTFSFTCTSPGADDTSFNISGTHLNAAASFNFEAKNSFDICIRVTDQNALTLDKNFIIHVNNINEAPTNISLSNKTVNENQPVNTVVGALIAADPDAGDVFTFGLTCTTAGPDDGSFNILGTNLRTSATFIFETRSIYNICVRVTDHGGLVYDKNLAVSVNNAIFLPVVIK